MISDGTESKMHNVSIMERVPNARSVLATHATTDNPDPAFEVPPQSWRVSEPARIVPYLRCDEWVSMVGWEGWFSVDV